MAPGYGLPAPQEPPQAALPGMPGGGGMIGSAGRSRADAERDALLARKLPEVKFDQTSVSDVIDHLRDVSGSNLVVDWRALESAGVKQNTNITLQLRNVSFRKALETALFLASGDRELLDYQADDGVILVSTAQKLRLAQREGVKAATSASPAPRIAPAAQPPAMGGFVPRGAGAANPFSPPNPQNRRSRTMPPDAPGTDPLPKTGTPKAGSNTPPGDYGRSPSNGGGSFRPGRAPHSANDGESAPEQPSPAKR
jgi:hypothetical protein